MVLRRTNKSAEVKVTIMNPLVSIITPCYNQAQYLPEALDSVLAQTYPYWECIIVNDCSQDNTKEIALKFCQKDNRFRYFGLESNKGLCHARNYAAQNSIGKYMLPLDSDDIIDKRYLEEAVKVLEHDDKVKVVYGQGEYFGELTGPIDNKPYDFETMLVENVFYNSVVYRREDYDRVGGYHEYMDSGLEDWELLISILDENSKVVQLPIVCYYYRIRGTSMFRTLSSERHAEMLLRAYNHHKELFDRHFPNSILYVHRWHDAMNRIKELENELEGIKQSRKYKLAQKLSNILHR